MINNNTVENGNGNLNPGFPHDNELHQDSLLRVAFRHRWIILFTVVLFLVAAFLYLLKATPIYTSTSRLYVEQSGPRIISEYEGIMTQSKNYLYTQSELIKSTPIISDVVDNAQIRHFKTFSEGSLVTSGRVDNLFDYIKGKLNIPIDKKEIAVIDNLVVYLKKQLDITVGKKDDIITVSFDSSYPTEAAQIVNAVVNSYIEFQSTSKRSSASEVLKILQNEKVHRDKELSANFARLLEFTRENGVVSLGKSDAHIVFKRLSKLSSALTDAQLETINSRADYEAVLSMAGESERIKQFAMAQPSAGVRVFVTDIETELRSELREMEIELKNVRYHCTEEHPSTQAVLGKINEIKYQLNAEAKSFADAYLEVMRLKWVIAKQREGKLNASFEVQQGFAQKLSVKAAEYYMLESDLKRTEKLCDILDDRIKELNVTEETGALNINILEVARPADKPSSPQRARVMGLALIMGLMFGWSFSFLREWFDYRLRSADEISAVLNAPVLGTVPSMPKKQSVIERGQKVFLESKSIIAESYRTIRTVIFFGVPKGKARSILVTSPAAGDGKSTLVSNLAITMAQSGQKTLILDADFRKPMQHNIFEVDNSKGLSSVLSGSISLAEAIHAGPVEGLGILPCGPEVPNPSEMLNSEAFVEMLQGLCEEYDRVLIDSPPVRPVADSQILAAVCDITLFVLRAERSTRKLSQQARDALLNVGAHIFGVVVNDVSRKRGSYGYYAGYGYYGHSHKEKV
ncbi:MAG: polysaccharide biosynthesis tyrosine autokinase [Planctomycetes bacterium]|nr:polysaccharide biosynthesis tyrosine autokinase [Planctomycetota bacterium]